MPEPLNGERIVVVKSWQTLLVLIAWLVGAVFEYASLRDQTQANTDRISVIEQNSVKKEQFAEMKEDILRRLQHIEEKLDRDRASRSNR